MFITTPTISREDIQARIERLVFGLPETITKDEAEVTLRWVRNLLSEKPLTLESFSEICKHGEFIVRTWVKGSAVELEIGREWDDAWEVEAQKKKELGLH